MFEARESLNPIMIRVGKPFTFFSNNDIREPDRLVKSQEFERVETLTGTATTRGAKPGKWAIFFELIVPPPTPRISVNSPTLGEPGEALVMFATLLDGETWGCYRSIENGKLIFNNWFVVENSDNKRAVIGLSEKKGSSLTVDGADVRYINFEFK